MKLQTSPGADPFRFKWNTGDTTLKLNNISAGNYMLTITSSRNTESIYTFNLTEPAILQANYNIKHASPGNNDGAVENLDITGGTPPYQYQISGGRLDSLAAGNYIIGIQDHNGCTLQVNIKIEVRTAVDNILDGTRYFIYPSPARELISLHVDGPGRLSKLELLDAQGRYIRNLNPEITEIDCSNWPPGYYGLQLWSKSGKNLVLRFEKL
ncbi:MAG: SprB repeat-containing protein [Saprospiraceae bacterium]|nr:SprB repeat-containing protein [Saprospiraceae bacterium]